MSYRRAKTWLKPRPLLGLIFTALLLSLTLAFAAPANLSTVAVVEVEPGVSSTGISHILKEAKVLKSAFFFQLIVKARGLSGSLKAGEYVFEKSLSPWALVDRLAEGVYSVNPLKVTVPEGLNMREIAALLENQLPDFDVERFLSIAEASEGEFMPATYFVSPFINEAKVAALMRDNFAKQIEPLLAEIQASGRSLNEILVMASLLEEEAATERDKKIIAGILWKRLDDGMLLQVDAVFPYIIGKNSFDLTRADLQIDSPYNTYKYEGLPPGPITNPGLESILAALRPEASSHWFYLSDRDGAMHYAETYDQHLANKRFYLD